MFKYIFSLVLAVILFFVFVFDLALTNDAIGNLFVAGILGCLVLFLLFKFGLHYKILALNRFANAFYYSVFEYKKAQVKPSDMTYMDSVREQAEVALAANFDPTLTTADLNIPATLYSGKDPFLAELRAKIQKAKEIKLKARHLDRKADVLLGKTKEELVEKDLADKTPARLLDRMLDIENGVAAIIDLTVDEIRHQGYGRAPDYQIITRIALDDNPYFARTFKFFASGDIVGVLFRAPFMIILLGIIGTFAGFYLALNQGGDIKSGASVAIISSLVGLPVSLLMEYVNTLFPDENQYRQAFEQYKVSLEMLFNHEQELHKEQAKGEAAKLKKEKELAFALQEERVDALSKQEAELDKQRQLEAEQELRKQAEGEVAKLKKEKELALAGGEQERVDALAKTEQAEGKSAKLKKGKKLALAIAEQERVDALAKTEQAEGKAAKLKKEKKLALAIAEQERVDALAKTEQAERKAAKLKKERELALAKAEQERVDALAKTEQAERKAAKLKKEKELALAIAEQERVDALAKTEQAERKAAKLKKELALAEG